jgi:hypothetical protein
MERDELIAKMRSRIDMCRRLARSTTDQKTARILLQMASEGEADVARLVVEQAEAGDPPSESDVIRITPTQE